MDNLGGNRMTRLDPKLASATGGTTGTGVAAAKGLVQDAATVDAKVKRLFESAS